MSSFTMHYPYSKALSFTLKNAAGEPLEVLPPHTVALVINNPLTWVRIYTSSEIMNIGGTFTLNVIIPSPENINLSAIKKLPYCGIVHYYLELRHPTDITVLLLEGEINLLHP